MYNSSRSHSSSDGRYSSYASAGHEVPVDGAGSTYPVPSTYSYNPGQQYSSSQSPPSLAINAQAPYLSSGMGGPPQRYSPAGLRDPPYSPTGYPPAAADYDPASYSGSYPSQQQQSMSQQNFIPTPSEIAHYSQPGSPSLSRHSTDAYANHAYPRHPSHHSARSPTDGRARSGSSAGQYRPSMHARSPSLAANPVAAAASPPERFACHICKKSFSRSHDRKRHHVGQHLDSHARPVCPNCHKDFSRPDSLKRHRDNGCDESATA